MQQLNSPFIVRNLTFGIEDSLISTTGVLLGIASAQVPNPQIILTGLILVFVEALSMSFGAFLSEDNFLKKENEKESQIPQRNSQQIIVYALTMFASYFIVGLILLLPFILETPYPIPTVFIMALVMLVTLIAFFETKMSKIIILSFIGGFIMVVSIGIGSLLA